MLAVSEHSMSGGGRCHAQSSVISVSLWGGSFATRSARTGATFVKIKMLKRSYFGNADVALLQTEPPGRADNHSKLGRAAECLYSKVFGKHSNCFCFFVCCQEWFCFSFDYFKKKLFTLYFVLSVQT